MFSLAEGSHCGSRRPSSVWRAPIVQLDQWHWATGESRPFSGACLIRASRQQGPPGRHSSGLSALAFVARDRLNPKSEEGTTAALRKGDIGISSYQVRRTLGSGAKQMSSKSDQDNHANQLNPNNDAYWQSRAEEERPSDLGRRPERVAEAQGRTGAPQAASIEPGQSPRSHAESGSSSLRHCHAHPTSV